MATDGRYMELLQRCVCEEAQDISLPVREGGMLIHRQGDRAQAGQGARSVAVFTECPHILGNT